jgi:hypothetical protein
MSLGRCSNCLSHRRLKIFPRDVNETPAQAKGDVDEAAASLVADLRVDIGLSSRTSAALDAGRIGRYRRRALTAPYGATAIPDYQEGKWADAAFVEQRADLGPRIATFLAQNAGLAGDILDFGTRLNCTWKDPATSKQTDWYRFQEAVRSHLDECWGVLAKRLPDLVS